MILGWIDPKGRKVELDDPFATMKTGVPRRILWDMAEHDESDERHQGDRLTVTGPNGCPRQLALTRMFDVYVNPQKFWTMTAGTHLHKTFGTLHIDERGSDGLPVWYTEEGHPEKCTFEGVIGGRKVGCLLDMVSRNAYDGIDYDGVREGPYNDGTIAIWDWKTSMNGASKWAGKEKQGKQWVTTGKAKPGHMAQLNMGRLLMEQRIGRPFTPNELVMCAWACSISWVDTYADFLTWEQIRELRTTGEPYTYTYGQLFDVIGQLFDDWQEAAIPYEGDIDAVPEEKKLEMVRALPVYGREMYQSRYGTSSCDNCAVQWMCNQVDGGI